MLVAGVDSSTQSCTLLVVDAESGEVVRSASTPHPPGTEVDPNEWWAALQGAIAAVGGLDDVAAVSVGGQQHGMIALDTEGQVLRPALLWNDTRSAGAARDLVSELGADQWAARVGTVPVASITAAKVRWLADHEPELADRVAALALPHDWLTWRLRGTGRLADLVTDRSDASGTGYFDPVTNEYQRDLLALALRRDSGDVHLPQVVSPSTALDGAGFALGAGCGDNAGAALGLGLRAGQSSISIGTSGVVAAVSATATHDASGLVAGFADATGLHLPLACTLNGARVLDTVRGLFDVSHDELSRLALSADPGAGGVVHVPYLEGERTPNLPDSTGTFAGLTLATSTRENLARAAVEGLWCLLAEAVDAMRAQGVQIEAASLIGGAAKSAAVRAIAPTVLGIDVTVPESAEYVALGAARQAAWALSGADEPPAWAVASVETVSGEHRPEILERYRAAAAGVLNRV